MIYAVEVKDVFKKYRIYTNKNSALKDKFLFSGKNNFTETQVLSGISLEVAKGEAIGLIGSNGCGKSTLLKLMSKIIYPDSGHISMNGRVSSLIELGAGFHPDMNGIENIYINASVFGLTRREIDKRRDKIIEFSELGDFINNPVRTYSSGMYTRLAFSVAINVDADILLIDEILAVGDTAFQKKCFHKLLEIKEKGTSIVMVSHSLQQIEQICERSVWIENGTVKLVGKPKNVHGEYLRSIGKSPTAPVAVPVKKYPISQDGLSYTAKITDIAMIDEHLNPCNNFCTGQYAAFRINYLAHPEKMDGLIVGINILRSDGIICYGTNTQLENITFPPDTSGEIIINFKSLNLLSGTYIIGCTLRDKNMNVYDIRENQTAFKFMVNSSTMEIGIAALPHEWSNK